MYADPGIHKIEVQKTSGSGFVGEKRWCLVPACLLCLLKGKKQKCCKVEKIEEHMYGNGGKKASVMNVRKLKHECETEQGRCRKPVHVNSRKYRGCNDSACHNICNKSQSIEKNMSENEFLAQGRKKNG